MAVCEHPKSPGVAFIGGQKKDGPQTPDHKLDDSHAALHIKTRFQLELFPAGEVERFFDSDAELLQQTCPLALSAPFLFFCDLTIGSRNNYASLFKHIR